MNWFDIIVITLLLRTSYIGYKNGLACEIYKVAGFGFSGLAAFYLYKKAAELVTQYTITIEESYVKIIALAAILLIGLFVFKVIFAFFQKIVQIGFAKNFNSIGGVIFGLGRGILIICLLYFVLNLSAADYIKESIQKKSFSGPYAQMLNIQLNSILAKILPQQ